MPNENQFCIIILNTVYWPVSYKNILQNPSEILPFSISKNPHSSPILLSLSLPLNSSPHSVKWKVRPCPLCYGQVECPSGENILTSWLFSLLRGQHHKDTLLFTYFYQQAHLQLPICGTENAVAPRKYVHSRINKEEKEKARPLKG